jgi:methionine-rich copper-binding protein CopC
MSKARISIVLFALVALFASVALAHILVDRTEPADGAIVSRPPSSLRVWFKRAPDVSKSELKLEGPTGEMKLEGLHTMGEDDLMVRIVGKMIDGEYTAHWKSAGDDGHEREGSWKFTVKRGG